MPDMTKLLLQGESRVDVYFDIGANIGGYSIQHAPFVKEIHAFEPVPHVFAQLEEAAKKIRATGVKMYCNKLGMSDTECTMRNMRVYEAWALLPEAPRHGLVGDIPSFDMEVTTLDSYVQNNNISKIDFIKLDVDGYELRVLRGGRKTIERDLPPIYIEISWLGKLLGDTNEDLGRLIIELGYRIFEVHGPSIKEQEIYGYTALMNHSHWKSSGDVVLVHQNRVGAIGL
jgi:FkbM family methyltransferase